MISFKCGEFNLKTVFIIGALLIVYTAGDSSVPSNNSGKIDYRLPTKIKPISYELDLTPHFDKSSGHEAFTFNGIVEISLQTEFQDVKEIVLHLKDINVKKIELRMKRLFGSFSWLMPQYRINKGILDNITDKYTIPLEQPLTPNQTYVLKFDYVGKLQTDMHGFYRSSYEENGKTVWLASTQMEPVYARRVFPCFDEPQFKAVFQVTITRPIDFEPTISNTPILKTLKNEFTGQVQETFEVTPKMSTYLLAFIVSKFKCRTNADNTFSVCSRPNAYNQTKYSFEVGQQLLNNFDRLFDYKYSTHMKKMTMAALPDFSAGAMENWGLTTYRETALLYDENISTALAQQRVATVVAHEETHMWFGDLVTCNWWSHTFLNEGFAAFFEFFGTAMVETKWDMEQQFLVETVQYVMQKDSFDDTWPIDNIAVYSPDDISKMFSDISYDKGASVIRMIEHIMGHDNFIHGLRNYLKNNALKTAVPNDLYNALQSVLSDNDDDIGQIMKSWVEKPGYPVINVSFHNDNTTIHIEQRQFLTNEPNHNRTTIWHIPITYATSKTDFNNTKKQFILSSDTMLINLGKQFDWIIFNIQQTGFYRVNYDTKMWKNIDRVLNDSPNDIHVLNRAQIVDDALNLARGELLSYTQALHTVHYLKNETDYVPWYAALTNFKFILNRFKSDERVIFEEFMLTLIDNVYSHLGFNPKVNETRLDVYNRDLILTYACRLGHEQCVSDAISAFENFTQKEVPIPVNLKPVVYCTAINQGGNETWQILWNKFQKENVAAEQVVILRALGCAQNKDLVLNYINEILGDKIRLQDKRFAFMTLLSQPQNIDFVLDYILKNHEQITKVFESKNEVPRFLSLLASQFTSNEQIQKLNTFVDANKLSLGPVDALQTSIKNANYNLQWAERNVPVIKKYLKPDLYSTDSTISTTSTTSTTPTISTGSASSAYTTIVSMVLSVWLPVLVFLCILN